jgi:hypothetical protein
MQFQGQVLATGTGFLVQRHHQIWLITNRHNLRGRHQETNQPLDKYGAVPDEVVICHNSAGTLGVWVNRIEPLWDADGQPLWREHPTLKGAADVVVLPLTSTAGIDVYAYDPWSPGFNIRLEPSQRLSIVGFPFGLTAGGLCAIWIGGTIASERGDNDTPGPLVNHGRRVPVPADRQTAEDGSGVRIGHIDARTDDAGGDRGDESMVGLGVHHDALRKPVQRYAPRGADRQSPDCSHDQQDHTHNQNRHPPERHASQPYRSTTLPQS